MQCCFKKKKSAPFLLHMTSQKQALLLATTYVCSHRCLCRYLKLLNILELGIG